MCYHTNSTTNHRPTAHPCIASSLSPLPVTSMLEHRHSWLGSSRIWTIEIAIPRSEFLETSSMLQRTPRGFHHSVMPKQTHVIGTECTYHMHGHDVELSYPPPPPAVLEYGQRTHDRVVWPSDPLRCCPKRVCLISIHTNRTCRAQLSRESERSNEKDPKFELKRWRDDGRCGPKYPAPGAKDFGECDPNADENEKGPCCNPQSGWCGNIRGKSWGHCPPACKHCIDFGPNGDHNNAVAKRVSGSTARPRKEDPPAPDGTVHDWGMSAMNATPPDGARIHQTIGLEDMMER